MTIFSLFLFLLFSAFTESRQTKRPLYLHTRRLALLSQANRTQFSLVSADYTKITNCVNTCFTENSNEHGYDYQKVDECVETNCPLYNLCTYKCDDDGKCADDCGEDSGCTAKCSEVKTNCIKSCIDDADEEKIKDYQEDCKKRCKDEFSDEEDIEECQRTCSHLMECPYDSNSAYKDACISGTKEECKAEFSGGDEDRARLRNEDAPYKTQAECESYFEDYCKKEANAFCPKSKWWLIVVIVVVAVVVVAAVVAVVIIIYCLKCKGKTANSKVSPSEGDTPSEEAQTQEATEN